MKQQAIDTFLKQFNGTAKKLDKDDVNYRVYDDKGNIFAFVDIVETDKLIKDAYPLSTLAWKVVKLCSKRMRPVLIWACKDGIIYGQATEMTGEIFWENNELRTRYGKQFGIKYLKYN